MNDQLNSGGVSRKRFLVGLTGTAGAVGGLLYPGISHAARLTQADSQLPPQTMDGPDPGFALGTVVKKSEDGIVVQTPTTARAIRIPPGPSVWKEFDVSIDAIEIGDFAHARGEPQVDGSLAVEPGWIWVNIGRSDGVIQSVDAKGMSIHGASQSHRVEFSQRLEVIHRVDESPVDGHVGGLLPGSVVGSVGLRLPDGSLRATRIWID